MELSGNLGLRHASGGLGEEGEGSSVRRAVLASSWTGVVVLVEQWSNKSGSCLYRSRCQSDCSKDTQGEHLVLDGQRLFVGYGVHVYR